MSTSLVLKTALRLGGGEALSTLHEALHPGAGYDDFLALLELDESGRGGADGPGLPTLPNDPGGAVAALAECDDVVRSSGGAYEVAAAEVLLDCLFRRLPREIPEIETVIDCDRAASLFRRRANQLADGLRQSVATGQTSAEHEASAAGLPSGSGGGEQGQRAAEVPRDANGAAAGSSAAADSSVAAAFWLPAALVPSENLTARLQEALPDGGQSPFDGDAKYEGIFEGVARILGRRQANHVLLVGERGVGKTLLLTELARRALAGRMPALAAKQVLAVDCHFIPRDESRDRLGAVLTLVCGRQDLIVCFRRFAALLQSERGASPNKGLLLSFLARARCRVVALLTPREYEELVSDDADMQEFFTRIDVDEPDLDVARRLLRHFAAGLEAKFGLSVDAEAVDRAVALTAGYVLNQRLPTKALRILLRVCEDVDYERTHLKSSRSRVTVDDVVRAVSDASGVPSETLRGISERTDYEQALGSIIVGQDHVVREVATELGLIKAGLTDAGKPASVMLFIGQTGTGKTEMAKALARLYSTSKRLKTYTLGNFIEPHSVAGIIGVPAGYVGHDQGGRLINDLNADPYGVFLLDEADKAHPDVLQPFLNLFDEGWIRDQRGSLAHADKSIFILTTNVGQRMIADMVREGQGMEAIAARMKEALSQIRHTKTDRPVFTPEFLARIKRLIVFRPLDRQGMAGISRKLAAEMRESWRQRRGKDIEIAEAVVDLIADKAHELNERSQGKEGGRIVRKLLADLVEAKIQAAISRSPDEYRDAAAVAVDLKADEASESPRVTVRFSR